MSGARAQRRGHFARLLLIAVFALGYPMCGSDAAWAKSKKEVVLAPTEKSYMAPYGLVVLGVVLGLIIVCRPGKRAAEPRRSDRKDQE